MKSKLTTKDVIAAGAFAAIYLVLLTVLAVMVLPIVPVLYLATPLIAGVLLGTVYMLYCVKVPRTGAVHSFYPGRAHYFYGQHLSLDRCRGMGLDCGGYSGKRAP